MQSNANCKSKKSIKQQKLNNLTTWTINPLIAYISPRASVIPMPMILITPWDPLWRLHPVLALNCGLIRKWTFVLCHWWPHVIKALAFLTETGRPQDEHSSTWLGDETLQYWLTHFFRSTVGTPPPHCPSPLPISLVNYHRQCFGFSWPHHFLDGNIPMFLSYRRHNWFDMWAQHQCVQLS